MAGAAALGLSRELRTQPVRNRPRTSRQGQVEHRPVAISPASSRPPRQAHSQHATSCRNRFLIRDRHSRFVQGSDEAFAGNGLRKRVPRLVRPPPAAARRRRRGPGLRLGGPGGRASWSAAVRQSPAKPARARTAQRPARRQRPRAQRRHYPARQPPHPTARRGSQRRWRARPGWPYGARAAAWRARAALAGWSAA